MMQRDNLVLPEIRNDDYKRVAWEYVELQAKGREGILGIEYFPDERKFLIFAKEPITDTKFWHKWQFDFAMLYGCGEMDEVKEASSSSAHPPP